MSIRLTHQSGDYLDPHNRQYQIKEHLSTGGMGTVYKAIDTFTGALKAVKECDILDDPRRRFVPRSEAVSKFLSEARCIEDLKHAGIPTGTLHPVKQENPKVCLQCGNHVEEPTCSVCQHQPDSLYYQPATIDYRYYLVMEYVEGQDIHECTRKMARPLSREDGRHIFSWLARVASILAYVHGRKLAHCDVKPENIRIRNEDGELFLLDFGLQRMESQSQKTALLTSKRGTSLGTPGYAAPEQEAGKACYASDIFALAMTAVSLLTDLDPSNPNDRAHILESRPKDLIPGLSDAVDTLLYRSLSMDADLRPDPAQWQQTLTVDDPFPMKPFRSADSPANTLSLPFQKLLKPLVFLLFLSFTGYAGWKWLVVPSQSDIVFGLAQQDGRIYRKPNGQEIIRRLDGGEALNLRKTSPKVEGYWFKVVTVNGKAASGFIERNQVQIDKPRNPSP